MYLISDNQVLLAIHLHEAHAVDVLAPPQQQLQVQTKGLCTPRGVPPGLVEGVDVQPPSSTPCRSVISLITIGGRRGGYPDESMP